MESQLHLAVAMALNRLHAADRIRQETRRNDETFQALARALTDSDFVLDLPAATPEDLGVEVVSQGTPRQLVGQPAFPGLASGRVCRITEGGDIGRFRAGNVLVCDAIQPMMTHLVPLAAAVVERRGGMLIHRAIIPLQALSLEDGRLSLAIPGARDLDADRILEIAAASLDPLILPAPTAQSGTSREPGLASTGRKSLLAGLVLVLAGVPERRQPLSAVRRTCYRILLCVDPSDKAARFGKWWMDVVGSVFSRVSLSYRCAHTRWPNTRCMDRPN